MNGWLHLWQSPTRGHGEPASSSRAKLCALRWLGRVMGKAQHPPRVSCHTLDWSGTNLHRDAVMRPCQDIVVRCAWAVWPPIAAFILCLKVQQTGAPQLRPPLHPPIGLVSPSGRPLSAPPAPPALCLCDGPAKRDSNGTAARREGWGGPQVIPSSALRLRAVLCCVTGGRGRLQDVVLSLSSQANAVACHTRRRVGGPAECKDAAFCPTLVRLEGPPCDATITASLAT